MIYKSISLLFVGEPGVCKCRSAQFMGKYSIIIVVLKCLRSTQLAIWIYVFPIWRQLQPEVPLMTQIEPNAGPRHPNHPLNKTTGSHLTTRWRTKETDEWTMQADGLTHTKTQSDNNTEGQFSVHICRSGLTHCCTQTHTQICMFACRCVCVKLSQTPLACFGNTSLEAARRHTASHDCIQHTGTQTHRKYTQGETLGDAVRHTQTQQKHVTQTMNTSEKQTQVTILDERGPCPWDARPYSVYTKIKDIYALCLHTATTQTRTRR